MRALKARWLAPNLRVEPLVLLEKLAEYPEGTLGKVWSGYFQKNGISPFTYEFPLQNDADFLYKRYRETHDIHHMLTGYGIDDFGEIEIQAFYVANLGLRHARLIVLAGLPYLCVCSSAPSPGWCVGWPRRIGTGSARATCWTQLTARYCPTGETAA